jgi:hypothetical protein
MQENAPGTNMTNPADTGSLGQVISARLFTAGLDLQYVLAATNHGPGEKRLEHAINEIDEAIKQLRHLMLAVMEQNGELA